MSSLQCNSTNVNNLLQNTETLRNSFICEKCNLSGNNLYRIKSCFHLICEKCSTDKYCAKCDTKVNEEDFCTDYTLSAVINSLDNIIQELQSAEEVTGSDEKCTSCEVCIMEEENFQADLETSELKDQNLNCDCSKFDLYTAEKLHRSDPANKRNAVGETKLHLACKKGNETEVVKLIETGADINAQDYAGWTPLHEAVVVGNKKIIKKLLHHGAVVNVPGDGYNTPLHKAVALKHTDIVKLLVKYGANIHVRNYDGLSPWDLADGDIRYTLHGLKSHFVPVMGQLKQHKEYQIFFAGEMTDEAKSAVEKFCTLFPTTKFVTSLNEHVTHVFVNTSRIVKPTYEFLLAILYSVPVLTTEWLTVCNVHETIVDYTDYLVVGTEEFPNDVIQRSLINRCKLNPNLFSGCSFFIKKIKTTFNINGISLNREKLFRLLTIGGGTILKREPHLPSISEEKHFPWHADDVISIEQCCHYIIYDSKDVPELKYNMRELRHVPFQWIYESILQFKLVTPSLVNCKD